MRHLTQEAPLRALFPAVEPEEAPEAAIVNTGGGVVGGDRYRLDIDVEADAALTITTPAAEKIYRSSGEDAEIVAHLRCGEGARLEWLPQETILFDGARLRRRIEIDLSPNARFLGVETILFGRRASGEWLNHGALRDAWMLRIDGKPAWADAIGLAGDIGARRAERFGLGEAAGYATIVVAGPHASALLPRARDLAQGAATLVNGVLLLRFLDSDAARLRGAVIDTLAALRPEATGGRGVAPRLWLN
ncbi:MAG TPA: urease accessory protein UreD [Methylosinus sp.]|uniref:urease accessory protein UreD n=1 Tax=Methylosinus sp. TaxID=427 RepID=UPI002F94EE28